jgi:hypothetical protein
VTFTYRPKSADGHDDVRTACQREHLTRLSSYTGVQIDVLARLAVARGLPSVVAKP